MKIKLNHWLVIFSAVLVMACTSEASEKGGSEMNVSPMERLPDNKAGTIISQAIKEAGGWENWANIKTLSYTKVIQQYDSTGAKKKEVRQFHQYQLNPLKVRFDWKEQGDKYTIINNGQQAWKYKNGKEMTGESDVNNAYNTSYGSHYTICMPFKLTDPGTVLTYEGTDTLPNGHEAHVIKTSYKDGAGSAAGMHTWWYYFDTDTNMLAANLLDYGDGFSYTQYEAFAEVQGIKINKQRKSSAANAAIELNPARTVYINENIRFNEELKDSLFEPMK